jgi:hypothetical protein
MAQENETQLQTQGINSDSQIESPLNAGQFVKNALDAIVDVAGAAEAKGIRNMTVGAGIVLLVLAITGAFVPTVGNSLPLAGALAGSALILAVLIVSSWDYRQSLEHETRLVELEIRRFEAEARYRIAQLDATQPTTPTPRPTPQPPR